MSGPARHRRCAVLLALVASAHAAHAGSVRGTFVGGTWGGKPPEQKQRRQSSDQPQPESAPGP